MENKFTACKVKNISMRRRGFGNVSTTFILSANRQDQLWKSWYIVDIGSALYIDVLLFTHSLRFGMTNAKLK
jgi:hypothetical protein